MEENPNAFQSLLRCFPDTKVPSHVSVILRFPNPKSKHGEIIQTRDLGLTQAMILMRIKLSTLTANEHLVLSGVKLLWFSQSGLLTAHVHDRSVSGSHSPNTCLCLFSSHCDKQWISRWIQKLGDLPLHSNHVNTWSFGRCLGKSDGHSLAILEFCVI